MRPCGNIRRVSLFRERGGVSPVIGVILMVAITIVLAAVVFMWIDNIIADEKSAVPAVDMAPIKSANGDYRILIQKVSRPSGTSSSVDGFDFALLDREGMVTSVSGSVNSIYNLDIYVDADQDGVPDYNITFIENDLEPNGQLDENDQFVLRSSLNGGVARPKYTFRLIYKWATSPVIVKEVRLVG